jgi:hypothetical protein
VFAPAAARQGDDLDAAIRAAQERVRQKEAVAAALVRGNMTADQAIAQYRRALAQDPVAQAGLRCRYPDAPADDLAVHMLIHFLERQRRQTPGGPDAVLAGLRTAVGRPGPERDDEDGTW